MKDESLRGKSYQIKIIKYRLTMAQKNLDRVVDRIQSGDLIDSNALENSQSSEEAPRKPEVVDFVDIYMKQMAMKYP